MSRDGSVLLTFLDGEEYEFRYGWGQIIKLQEARDCGPFLIYQRLFDQSWRVEDIREVIRFGLIGGGMDPVRAKRLILEFVETDAPLASLPLAQRVLTAALVGSDDEEVIEKKSEAASGLTTSPTVESASPLSTEPVH